MIPITSITNDRRNFETGKSNNFELINFKRDKQMASMIEVTQAGDSVTVKNADEKILVNADMIIRIEDTDENYAGDSRILLIDGTPIYVNESLQKLSRLINS